MAQYRILIDGVEVCAPMQHYPTDWGSRREIAIERGLRITLQRQQVLSSIPVTHNPGRYMQLPNGKVLCEWETLADCNGREYSAPTVIGA